MRYVKIVDGQVAEYTYPLIKFRTDNSGISFPSEIPLNLLEEFNVFPVTPTAKPDKTLTQDPQEQLPQLVDGVWTQAWVMVNVASEEAAQRQQIASRAVDAASVKADTFVNRFIAMTPDQVSDYVDANTANITQVRALINKMALMLLVVAREVYK